MKKNVLIISYAYPPNNVAGAQRPYALAKFLDKNKYNIKVITCENPDMSIGENKEFDPNLEGVKLIKIKSKIGNSASKLRTVTESTRSKKAVFSKLKSFLFKAGQQLIFPDKGMFWTPNVKAYLKQNKNLIEETDIVFSTSPGITNHQVAQSIIRANKNIRWIADFRDFNYVEHWIDNKGIKSLLHKKIESSFVKEASSLTFVTKTMQLAYQKFYPQHKDKMHCAYNGFEKNNLTNNDLIKHSNKLSFFYAGSFYNGMRSPYTLLNLVDKALEKKLIEKKDIQINIAGNIDSDMTFKMKQYKSFDCVNFLGSIPRTKVLQKMEESYFLWLIVANLKSHYQTVPIKLFEYIAARRPIINFAPNISEPSQIIEENNFGYNFNTLEFKINEAYPNFKKLISDFKNNKFDEPLSEQNLSFFTWEKQIKQIEKLF